MPGGHPHAHENVLKPALVAVVTVTDSRSPGDDASGALLSELASQAGHDVVGRDLVPDEIDRIRAAVERLAKAGADVVLLTGGTGLSARDVTPEAIRPLFQREIEGFGELFRWLSWQEIGPAAQFSRAAAGVVGTTAVFALPGSPGGCRLAMNKLILPELGHLLTQLRKAPAPRPAGAPVPLSSGLRVAPLSVAPSVQESTEDSPTQSYQVEALDLRSEVPASEPVATGPAGMRVGMVEPTVAAAPVAPAEGAESSGWQAALAGLGATLDREKRLALPPEIASIAPLVSVLDEAGQVSVLVLADGRRYSLWGFPDLERRGSRVVAIGATVQSGGDATEIPEIVALHRWPSRAGTCVGDRPLVPGHDESVESATERVTGRAPRDRTGTVLALDRGNVWILRSKRVIRWDGRKESDEGPVRAALGRLVLSWSQR